MDRIDIVHSQFRARLSEGDLPTARSRRQPSDAGLDAAALRLLFRAQAMSRHLDRMARALQARGKAFYTIGSSGHEGMAATAWALRQDDPAFLHYRDGAFQTARALRAPGTQPLRDMALSFVSAAADPISGGRHKVLGSKALAIPPQTSTIASHLPKAVGAAHAIGLAKRLKLEGRTTPDDAVVCASFGDASLNHASAQTALNAAGWTAFQDLPLPLLFVCEDNGLGISVKTPPGWVAASLRGRAGLAYAACDGLDVVDVAAVARDTVDWCRTQRRPACLHFHCVRLYGHAGADAPQSYLTLDEIEAAEAQDPLLHTARRLLEAGAASADEVLALYDAVAEEAFAEGEAAAAAPALRDAAEVAASLIPPPRAAAPALRLSESDRRERFGAAEARALATPQPMSRLINAALVDLMLETPDIALFGEDVGRKGGVYGVTRGLWKKFGPARVFDTLLDEQTILGLAIGLAQNGLTPIPEIQFLAYLHNAEDQLRGEAATLPFFSNGQFSNPMVVRIAGLAYQRGFGGHFHNDNSIAALRDIPGLVIACPSNGRDAALMLRECVRLAREEQRVVVFLEPIALYNTRDLHRDGDLGWTCLYPPPGEPSIELGAVGVDGAGTDLAFVSYANGHRFCRQAQEILRDADGVDARCVDLRWLAPLPEQALLAAVAPCPRIVVVDECRRTGSQSEALTTFFTERAPAKTVTRVTAEDCFIATGPAYAATLPSRDDIIEAARAAFLPPS